MTTIPGFTAPGPVSTQSVAFTDGNGYGIGFKTYAGKIANVTANSFTFANNVVTITELICSVLKGTSSFTDRSLDTFTIPLSALSSLSSRAGSQAVANISPAAARDLGGAHGSANVGLGFVDARKLRNRFRLRRHHRRQSIRQYHLPAQSIFRMR